MLFFFLIYLITNLAAEKQKLSNIALMVSPTPLAPTLFIPDGNIQRLVPQIKVFSPNQIKTPAVFLFIIWSISGDNTIKVKMSFFSTFFPCFCPFSSATIQNTSSCFTPLNMSHSTRTQLTSNKLNYDIFRNTFKKKIKVQP